MAPPKVLVIDDEKLFREMLGVVLRDDYEVLSADSTDAGLRVLRESHPDAVLLDLVMPGRDGIQGLKAIREVDPDVAVIIVTGFAKLETAERAIELGASAYVEKPIHPEVLRRTLRRGVESTQLHKRRSTSVDEMTQLIRHLGDNLEEQKHKANQGEVAVELMYDLMYPLTNSLMQLKALSELLQEPECKRDDAWRQKMRWLSLVEKSIERCRELTQTCRELSSGVEIQKEPVSLSDLARKVVKECMPWAAGAGVDIDFRMHAHGGKIWGNEAHMERVIRNLLTQAVESTAMKGGTVRVACSETGQHLELRVEDHGSGYDLERLHCEMGDAFGRREIAQGAGLGFCLVRKIIENHTGVLNIQTEPGKGCVVWMKLPLAGWTAG